MVATTLIALVLIPAFDALLGGMDSSSAHEELTTQHYRAQARLADLDAVDFEDLDIAAQAAGSASVPSSYSDAPGTPMRRLVYLSRYDFDAAPPTPDPSADYGALWIRVTIEGAAHGFEVLRAK